MKLSEADLIQQLKQGDSRAVKSWFDQYYSRLLRLTLAKVGDGAKAEELVQETFINCLKQLPLFQGRSSLLTWMQSVLRHEIADYYRKLYAKKAIRALPLSELILSQPVADAHETAAKVRLVLGQMVAERRELLLSKYVDKKKVKQLALELGRTVKSVESDLFRARLEFKKLYASVDELEV